VWYQELYFKKEGKEWPNVGLKRPHMAAKLKHTALFSGMFVEK
jgi:hypothetical protein